MQKKFESLSDEKKNQIVFDVDTVVMTLCAELKKPKIPMKIKLRKEKPKEDTSSKQDLVNVEVDLIGNDTTSKISPQKENLDIVDKGN